MKKRLVILGSSGSIGESAVRVAHALESRFEILALAVHQNYRKALEQAQRVGARHIAVSDPEAARACAAAAPRGIRVHAGVEGLSEIAAMPEGDIVLCAVVGMAGLRPVMAAINRGAVVALATKEVLVGAGALVTEACAAHGARLRPVDSEHSAIFQCIEGQPPDSVSRLFLTASGGPFAAKTGVDFDRVTIAEALAHPRWNMGRKVTVDSATMMNKGLEIIEAHWLFGVPFDRIEVLIHPESIVHSMVEFRDRGILAQMSLPDMRFAIQYALTYPERLDGGLPPLDLVKMGPLHFREPDPSRFPCLDLARAAANAGGTLPAVMNAANEVAVQQFLTGQISFAGIWRTVRRVMERHQLAPRPGLDDVIEADAWARRAAQQEGASAC